jgi:hypothetical protein
VPEIGLRKIKLKMDVCIAKEGIRMVVIVSTILRKYI